MCIHSWFIFLSSLKNLGLYSLIYIFANNIWKIAEGYGSIFRSFCLVVFLLSFVIDLFEIPGLFFFFPSQNETTWNDLQKTLCPFPFLRKIKSLISLGIIFKFPCFTDYINNADWPAATLISIWKWIFGRIPAAAVCRMQPDRSDSPPWWVIMARLDSLER